MPEIMPPIENDQSLQKKPCNFAIRATRKKIIAAQKKATRDQIKLQKIKLIIIIIINLVFIFLNTLENK